MSNAFSFKTRDLSKMFMDCHGVVGLTRMSNIEMKEKNEWKQLDWIDFKELWTFDKWGNEENHVFQYLAEAKKMVEGLGCKITDCTFYFHKNEPLVIQLPDYVGSVDDPYVICIGPKLINVEGGESKVD